MFITRRVKVVPIKSKTFLVIVAVALVVLFCCNGKANANTEGEAIFKDMSKCCPEFVKKIGLKESELKKWDNLSLTAAKGSCDISLLSKMDFLQNMLKVIQ